MECWIAGRSSIIIPTFQYSIFSILVSDILRKPLQRQRVPQAFGPRQLIGCAAYGGELQTLGALIV
jgi:hypothetical protein